VASAALGTCALVGAPARGSPGCGLDRGPGSALRARSRGARLLRCPRGDFARRERMPLRTLSMGGWAARREAGCLYARIANSLPTGGREEVRDAGAAAQRRIRFAVEPASRRAANR